jgi:hypothetical protein
MQLILLSEPVWIKICRKIDEISRKVLIAGVIGYDSIRKHLVECERQEEKEILSAMSGCVDGFAEEK